MTNFIIERRLDSENSEWRPVFESSMFYNQVKLILEDSFHNDFTLKLTYPDGSYFEWRKKPEITIEERIDAVLPTTSASSVINALAKAGLKIVEDNDD